MSTETEIIKSRLLSLLAKANGFYDGQEDSPTISVMRSTKPFGEGTSIHTYRVVVDLYMDKSDGIGCIDWLVGAVTEEDALLLIEARYLRHVRDIACQCLCVLSGIAHGGENSVVMDEKIKAVLAR